MNEIAMSRSLLENTAVRIFAARAQRVKVYRFEVDQALAMILWGAWIFLPGEQMNYAPAVMHNELYWGGGMFLVGALRLLSAFRGTVRARWLCALMSGFAWATITAIACFANPWAIRTAMLGWFAYASFRSYLSIKAKALRDAR